jgi:hypothetical protein
MSEELTMVESRKLRALEKIIETGLRTFTDVGRALLEIRDGNLYRAFKTFDEYCLKTWQLERSRVYQLMDSVQVVGNLKMSTTVDILPTNERQARPLTLLPPPQQREAWETAVKAAPNGKPTARQVAAAVARVLLPSPGPASDGDSAEVCWRRGLLYRAAEAEVGAEFEDWGNFKVDSRLVAAANRAAGAWEKLSGYLRTLQNEQKEKRARAA